MARNKETFVLFVREANGIRFEWQGGPYIDTFSRNKSYPKQEEALWITNNTMRDPGWYYTDVNINVWNDETGKPRIPLTQKAFDKKVDEWIAENS